jgi:hypothetical protein
MEGCILRRCSAIRFKGVSSKFPFKIGNFTSKAGAILARTQIFGSTDWASVTKGDQQVADVVTSGKASRRKWGRRLR